jgi:hypothetical protein
MCEADENLANTWFRGIDLLDLGGDLAWFIVDDGFVAGGDFDGSHGGFQGDV